MIHQAPGIRTFIALPSSTQFKDALRKLQSSLIEERADVKWDSPDKFHITLKFLGNVVAEKIAEVSNSLAKVTLAADSFKLIYTLVGAFPDLERPRVIWVGAQPNDALASLQREVERACDQLGFVREARAFHPHITLGRVKGSMNLARLTAKVKTVTFEPIMTDCSEVLLIKSDLRPTGSVYTTLKSFPLKA